MTIKELKKRVRFRHSGGYCQYIITIEYRGKEYSCQSNNAPAYDWYNDDSNPRKQSKALREAWNECKRKNNLQ